MMLLWGIVPAPTTVFLWDWANAIGYLAVALLFLLFVYRGQPQSLPAFSGRFFINFHRDLGILSLIFVGLHMGVLLASAPLLMEHLKPTAPWYMLSGLASAVLLIMIVLS
ncbi:MAG: ferric reductase like transmembrane component, partial [Pseudomonadales bacterium]|nr:ferric reductase like transmembrane component [Pseudomonadales bacterium]